ncbi:MAG: amidohydrolase family protein [Kofleriaceae bacterium]
MRRAPASRWRSTSTRTSPARPSCAGRCSRAPTRCSSPGRTPWPGWRRDLRDIAAEWGVDVHEAADRLQPAGAIYFMMDEADVRAALAHPAAMIGSDGIPFDAHPHPRLWGTFPRVLGHYSRDLRLFPLEDAVHRMTGKSARVFGLAGRGVVRAGAFADLCVFDPETVRDTASFESPIATSTGIGSVVVNGALVWHDGAPTGARPGRVLRRQALREEAARAT